MNILLTCYLLRNKKDTFLNSFTLIRIPLRHMKRESPTYESCPHLTDISVLWSSRLWYCVMLQVCTNMVSCVSIFSVELKWVHWCNGHSLGSYSGGPGFESQLTYPFKWLIFCGFLQPLQANVRIVLWLDHDCFPQILSKLSYIYHPNIWWNIV